MKKIKLFFAVMVLSISTVTTTSCSSDDGGTPVNNQPVGNVEGKWNYAKEGVSAMNVEHLVDYEHTEGCTKDHIEVVAGGAFKDRMYMGSACDVQEDTGTWAKTGNNVTVNLNGATVTWEIVSLTATEMKVRTPFTMEGQTYYDVTLFTRS